MRFISRGAWAKPRFALAHAGRYSNPELRIRGAGVRASPAVAGAMQQVPGRLQARQAGSSPRIGRCGRADATNSRVSSTLFNPHLPGRRVECRTAAGYDAAEEEDCESLGYP